MRAAAALLLPLAPAAALATPLPVPLRSHAPVRQLLVARTSCATPLPARTHHALARSLAWLTKNARQDQRSCRARSLSHAPAPLPRSPPGFLLQASAPARSLHLQSPLPTLATRAG